MYLGELHERVGLSDELMSDDHVATMRQSLLAGDLWVIRQAFDRERLRQIREYLAEIGRTSLPNYEAIALGAPNFHRVVRPDSRTYVQGCFHQWSFFPWNHDVLGLFAFFRRAYELNNAINGRPRDSFLGLQPQYGCIARLAFQSYPRGIGYLNRHQDVVGPHKFTTMTVCLSTKGADYDRGGLYLGTGENQPDFDVDAATESGDLSFMCSEIVHGVQPIDPDAEGNWLAFDGKWSCVLAVNKLADTDTVSDSVDLEK